MTIARFNMSAIANAMNAIYNSYYNQLLKKKLISNLFFLKSVTLI